MPGCSSYCKVHRRYRGIRKPRTTCEPCWALWFANDPGRFRRIVALSLAEAFLSIKRGCKL